MNTRVSYPYSAGPIPSAFVSDPGSRSMVGSLVAVALVTGLALGAALSVAITDQQPAGTSARAKVRFAPAASAANAETTPAVHGTALRAKVRSENPIEGSEAARAVAPVAAPRVSGRALARQR